MTKRIFMVKIEIEVELELDQSVIDAVDDEWRGIFYSDLKTEEDIAGHIATNLVRGFSLSHLDGWADQSDSNAIIVDEEWSTEVK